MQNQLLKIRISVGKNVAMGPGKADLLQAIDTLGSITAAAKSMKMSYRRAWELVNMMNKSFTQPLVTSSPGGQHGGGAQLTEFGRFILKNYLDLITKTQLAASIELANISEHLNRLE